MSCNYNNLINITSRTNIATNSHFGMVFLIQDNETMCWVLLTSEMAKYAHTPGKRFPMWGKFRIFRENSYIFRTKILFADKNFSRLDSSQSGFEIIDFYMIIRKHAYQLNLFGWCRKCFRPFLNIIEHFGTFWNIWEHFIPTCSKAVQNATKQPQTVQNCPKWSQIFIYRPYCKEPSHETRMWTLQTGASVMTFWPTDLLELTPWGVDCLRSWPLEELTP